MIRPANLFPNVCLLGQIVVIATLVAPPAEAQTQPIGVPGDPFAPTPRLGAPAAQRSFRGLFGPTGPNQNSQQLDFTGSVFAIHSTTGAPSDTQTRYQATGNSVGGRASLNYSALLSKLSFTANGGTVASYYSGFTNPVQMSYAGGVGASTTLGTRTTISGSQTFSYAPFFGFFPFAGLLPTAPADLVVNLPNDQYAVAPERSIGMATNLTVSRTLTRRTSLGGFYTLNRVTFTKSADMNNQAAGISVSRGLTRNSSFRLAYAFRDGAYGAVPFDPTLPQPGGVIVANNETTHDIDAGVDYARALSPWRRTTVTFGTGSSLVRRLADTQQPAAPSRRSLTLWVNGFVAVNREVGRSWNLLGTYRRSVSYVPGFSNPFFSDAVSGAANGALARRLTVSGQVSGSRGSVGLAPKGASGQNYGNSFWAYSGSAVAQYALARHLAAYANYVYYNYAFGAAVGLPRGVQQASGRHSIQGGLTTWLPLLRR